MKVSVVMPNLNGQDFLQEAIESVLAQTVQDWELLVIDDGSTDDSIPIVQRFASQDERIRLLRHPNNENRGVSRTRQLGFSQARGDWIALLDADDIFLPEKLSLQLDALRHHPDCVMVHGGGKCIDRNSKPLTGPSLIDSFNEFASTTREYKLREQNHFLSQNFVLNSSSMIRKSALESINYGFNQLFQYEDWTLWIRLSNHGPFLVLAQDLVRYRTHQNSATEKVVSNGLVEAYSHIEFLLSVLATENCEEIRTQAASVLESKLAQATKLYGAPAELAPLHFGVSIEPESNVSAKPKSGHRWLKKFFRRAA